MRHGHPPHSLVFSCCSTDKTRDRILVTINQWARSEQVKLSFVLYSVIAVIQGCLGKLSFIVNSKPTSTVSLHQSHLPPIPSSPLSYGHLGSVCPHLCPHIMVVVVPLDTFYNLKLLNHFVVLFSLLKVILNCNIILFSIEQLSKCFSNMSAYYLAGRSVPLCHWPLPSR